MTGTGRGPQPQRYEICIRGRLGQTLRSAFPALQARARSGDTILAGVLADQAALYGVLAEIEALGLELIGVRRLRPHRPRVDRDEPFSKQPGQRASPYTSLLAGQQVLNVHGSSEPREDDEGPGQGMSRLLALSDGVFAVAITLLVFNLGVSPGQPLSAGLAHLGDRAWAAALSFALIGRYWMIHRRIFARVRRHDDRLLVLNLVFLAAVVAMPFATELLAYPGRRPVQVITYASLVGVAALLATAIWCYAFAARLTGDRPPAPRTAAVIASGLPGGLVTALVCSVSVAVARASPAAGELVWVALAVPSRWLAPRFLPLARRLTAADWRPRAQRDRGSSWKAGQRPARENAR